MSNVIRPLLFGSLALLGLTGGVLILTFAFLRPPAADLAALALFLIISGGLTLLLGMIAARLEWAGLAWSLRTRIFMSSVIATILALANVAFVARLMFLSAHDLALLVALLAFALGTSVVVANILSASVLKSFKEMTEAVARVGSENFEERLPIRSRDEVGKLATAFNDMTERLEASTAKQRELENARRELIASVSHDLRTPLASIRAMVEAINDGVVADQETKSRYLQTIEAESENLSRLIDDLFELSQIDAGVMELHLESASLTDLISDTLGSMSAQAAERRLHLQGSVEGHQAPVVMDAKRVQRVLYNLVQNAIQHTPADGTISILAKDADSEMRVEVCDTGEGIPEAELERVFERFYRSDRARSRYTPGAGLGLSIAKGIVEAHGGRLWVESTLGKGSTFGFALPKPK